MQLRALVFVLLTALLVVGDTVTDVNLGFTAMYVLPVAGAAWFVGANFSIGLALVTAITSEAVATFQSIRPTHVTVWNAVMELTVLLIVSRLVTALSSALHHERTRANTDPLTGVMSRSGFIDAATRELDRARRFGRPVVVAYLDVDHFKRVNDSLGHHQGDALLKTIGATLREELRALDLVGRIGGDEFAIVLPELSMNDARLVLARVATRLKSSTFAFGDFLGFSFGIADAENASLDEALRAADAQMYAVKQRGR